MNINSKMDFIKGQDIASLTHDSESERNFGELGKDEFIKLLITQLRHQDPMNPVDDKEFIGQMAQFSALEQMQNVSAGINSVRGATLLGKEVKASVSSHGEGVSQVSGTVTAVKNKSGNTFVVVNGREVKVEDVEEISMANVGDVIEENEGMG